MEDVSVLIHEGNAVSNPGERQPGVVCDHGPIPIPSGSGVPACLLQESHAITSCILTNNHN